MQREDFHFKKKYGQNFIKDISIVRRMAERVEIKKNSLVIEIGPGSGVLTKQLAPLARNVLCYEIDNELEDILALELKEFANVKVIFDDFLKRIVKDDIKDYNFDHLYVVANLPYYITTPILLKLVQEDLPLEKIVVMVQKEVGDRFSASVGSKDYGSLTVYLEYYFDIKKEFVVSRNNFVPRPNVDSVIVSFTKKEEVSEVDDLDFFFTFVRDSFQYKRKNLRNNWKNYDLKVLEEALNEKSKDLTFRAEQLTLEDFVFISNYYCKHKEN